MIPRLATDAVAIGSDHAGAEFVEDLERRLVEVQAQLALELDGRDAWRMARNEVSGPEPDRQRRAGPLHGVGEYQDVVCLGVNRISMVYRNQNFSTTNRVLRLASSVGAVHTAKLAATPR